VTRVSPPRGTLIDRIEGLARVWGRRWQEIIAIAAPVVLILVTIGPALIGRETIVSVTLLTRHMPWQAFFGSDAPGHQYCSTDTIDSVLPGTKYIRDQIFSGHLANWQSLSSGGTPLGSQPDLGVLTPLSLPYFLLPIWLAPAFVKFGELVVAIGGMYLFLRRLGRSRLASSMAGMVFATSGFMVLWSTWPQTRTAAYIPALFWAIERLVQRRRLADSVLVGVVLACMLLAGFPEVTGFTLYLGAAYLMVRAFARYGRQWTRVGNGIGLAALGLVLGVLLAAVQLLPFAKALSNQDLAYRAQNPGLHLPLVDLLSLIAPDAQGSCINASVRGTVNPVESIAFVGSAAVVMAILAISLLPWRRSRRDGSRDRGVTTFFAIAVGVIVILGWVGGRLLGFAQHFPVFENNFIGRIRVLLGFGAAVLAGYGLDRLLNARGRLRSGGPDDDRGDDDHDGDDHDGDDHDGDDHHENHDDPFDPSAPAGSSTGEAGADARGLRRAAVGAGRQRVALAAVWFVLVWLAVIAFGVREGARFTGLMWSGSWRLLHNPSFTVPIVLVLITMAVAILGWVASWRWLRAAAVTAVVVLVVVQSASFFRLILPGNTLADFYPRTGAHEFLAAHDGDDRFDGAGGTLYPDTAMYFGLRAATGHEFLTKSWADLLTAVDPNVAQSPTAYAFSTLVTPENVGSSPILDRMGVKYFAFDPDLLPGASADPISGSGTTALGAGASCAIGGGALRGVQIMLPDAMVASGASGITVHATVHAGQEMLSGAIYLGSRTAANKLVAIPVAGEDIADDQSPTVDISVTGASGPVSVEAEGPSVACRAVRPLADHLKLVYVDAGTIIFQRLTALPRIRWASGSTVITSRPAQLAALKAGVPRDQVVLGAPAGTGSGQPATTHVTNDSGDRITTQVDAKAAGYLVVADSMDVPGWTVTIDGKPAQLVPADYAMVAVAVPAGTHVVRMSYNAPGQLSGLALTVFGLLLLIALLIMDRRRSVLIGWLRRRQARHGGAESHDPTVSQSTGSAASQP
jgi:hypothetical protein